MRRTRGARGFVSDLFKKSNLIQRESVKKFTDPSAWDTEGDKYRKRQENIRFESREFDAHHNIIEDGRDKGPSSAHQEGDAEVYYQEMERVEKEYRQDTKINPDEVTDALRTKLWQQRKYLSYKNSMQRLGIPASTHLSFDDWVAEDDTPLDIETKDRWSIMADKMAFYEVPDQSGDMANPAFHDAYTTLEQTDNRVSERMLADLMELKDEDKLDYEAAGKMLNRSPEVLRRICAPIRRVPLTHCDTSVMDHATWLACLYEGGQIEQLQVAQLGGIRTMSERFRSIKMYDLPTLYINRYSSNNYQIGGGFPQNLPSHNFKPPPGSQRTQTVRPGPGYGDEDVARF